MIKPLKTESFANSEAKLNEVHSKMNELVQWANALDHRLKNCNCKNYTDA